MTHKLSNFFDNTLKDGLFTQTQFAATIQKNSLCFAAKLKYIQQINSNASVTCVVTTPDLAHEIAKDKSIAIVDNPEEQFYHCHNILTKQHNMQPSLKPHIDPTATIHTTAFIDKYVSIGKNVTIEAGAVVLSNTILEENVLIGPNAVIGADGHFYKRYHNRLFRVLHSGGVHIKKEAHILAGAIISKALHTDYTTIGEETVISINSHVAHGCNIGKRCIIAGKSQIAGYTNIHNNVWIAPSSTVGNLLTIKSGAAIEIGSVVIENIEENERVSGNPAINHKRNMMNYVRNKQKRKSK